MYTVDFIYPYWSPQISVGDCSKALLASEMKGSRKPQGRALQDTKELEGIEHVHSRATTEQNVMCFRQDIGEVY